jgi:hypothetical protein
VQPAPTQLKEIDVIGMPKSMMQEEMSPLGPVVKKADAFMLTKKVSQEEFRAQFERGEHLPTGEVVRKREGVRKVYTTFDWLDGSREVVHQTVRVPAATEAGPDKAEGPWVKVHEAQHQHLLDTINQLRAATAALNEQCARLTNQRDAAWRQLNAAGLLVQPSFQGVPLKFDSSFQDCTSPGHGVGTFGQPKPDADGWIAWAGGECPVAAGVKVLVKHRDGRTDIVQEGKPFTATEIGESWWEHGYGGAKTHCQDIVAYRVVEEKPANPHLMPGTRFNVEKALESLLGQPGEHFKTGGRMPDDIHRLNRRLIGLHYVSGKTEVLMSTRPPVWAGVESIELIR